MTGRTYSAETYRAARDAWAWGRFGAEWLPYRKAAAERGFLFPPAGSEYDDPECEDPSQRAVLHEAISNTPRYMLGAVKASRSWHEVVARVTQYRASLREEADLAERDAEWEKRSELSRSEAYERLSDIMRRVAS